MEGTEFRVQNPTVWPGLSATGVHQATAPHSSNNETKGTTSPSLPGRTAQKKPSLRRQL